MDCPQKHFPQCLVGAIIGLKPTANKGTVVLLTRVSKQNMTKVLEI